MQRWKQVPWRTVLTYGLAVLLGWSGAMLAGWLRAPTDPPLLMPPGTVRATFEVAGTQPAPVLDAYANELVRWGWERAGSTGQTIIERAGAACTNLRMTAAPLVTTVGAAIVQVSVVPAPLSC